VFEGRVEDDDELSGGSNESDFRGFAIGAEALVEGFEGTFANGGKRGHVEGFTDFVPAAVDMTLTAQGATIVIEGSQADESGDLAPGGESELGEMSQESGGCEVADAVVGGKFVVLSKEERIVLDLGGHDGFQGFDLALDGGEGDFEDAFGEGSLEVFTMIDELCANGDKLFTQGGEFA